jgi:hypothetical protein
MTSDIKSETHCSGNNRQFPMGSAARGRFADNAENRGHCERRPSAGTSPRGVARWALLARLWPIRAPSRPSTGHEIRPDGAPAHALTSALLAERGPGRATRRNFELIAVLRTTNAANQRIAVRVHVKLFVPPFNGHFFFDNCPSHCNVSLRQKLPIDPTPKFYRVRLFSCNVLLTTVLDKLGGIKARYTSHFWPAN